MNGPIQSLLSDQTFSSHVNTTWQNITRLYQEFDAVYENPKMSRRELGFHDEVRLLAYAVAATESIGGDILEIGVWKGKSLALMRAFAGKQRRVVGIDPLAVPGQVEDFSYFYRSMLTDVYFIHSYSERSLAKVLEFSKQYSVMHIDGGHAFNNVLTDFILFEGFLVEGGFIIFDDYGDHLHSPEVKPAVDFIVKELIGAGYENIGQVEGFKCPYILRKRAIG